MRPTADSGPPRSARTPAEAYAARDSTTVDKPPSEVLGIEGTDRVLDGGAVGQVHAAALQLRRERLRRPPGCRVTERLLELVKVLVDRRDHGLDPAILDTPATQREADPAA